jgi:hypothetical protein
MRLLNRVHRHALVALALATGVAACGGQPTPTPPAAPATPTAAAGASLTVDRDVVKYRERETDELKVVESGNTVTVVPGGNIVVDDRGRATLAWPMFLENSLLSNADTLLSLSEPASRHAILDQAAGIGRYTVEGDGEPTDLQVNAGFVGVGKSVVVVNVKQGPADFVVSVDLDNQPTVWVVMRDGSAEVVRGTDKLTLTTDQVAAFTQDGPMPKPQPIDSKVFRIWLDAVVDGEAPGGIASVGFRCVVTADPATLRAGPSASQKSLGTLPRGTMVTVVGRNPESTFLEATEDGKTLQGWIATSEVACAAPISAAPIVIMGVTSTPTRIGTRPPARLTATRTPTGVGSPTVTPTGTATGAAYVFEFGVSPSTIESGDCATLEWNVEGVQAVYLDGDGVGGGKQTKKVCPTSTTTYTMEVVKTDGTKESKSVTVKVTSAATLPPAATATPQVDPTDTPQPTDEPSDTPEPAASDTPEPQATDTPSAGTSVARRR